MQYQTIALVCLLTLTAGSPLPTSNSTEVVDETFTDATATDYDYYPTTSSIYSGAPTVEFRDDNSTGNSTEVLAGAGAVTEVYGIGEDSEVVDSSSSESSDSEDSDYDEISSMTSSDMSHDSEFSHNSEFSHSDSEYNSAESSSYNSEDSDSGSTSSDSSGSTSSDSSDSKSSNSDSKSSDSDSGSTNSDSDSTGSDDSGSNDSDSKDESESSDNDGSSSDESGDSIENSVDISDNRSGSSLESTEKAAKRKEFLNNGIDKFDKDIKSFLDSVGKGELYGNSAVSITSSVSSLMVLLIAAVTLL